MKFIKLKYLETIKKNVMEAHKNDEPAQIPQDPEKQTEKQEREYREQKHGKDIPGDPNKSLKETEKDYRDSEKGKKDRH